MTLVKKHFHRLWFPEPGTGGDIPSRAGHGMTRAEFDAAMPEEFWREVVDRVAKEVPDTLLLAEAFWLLEGYFVRSLGMHRVYNSAFMNMLRDEMNAEYRHLISSTLEYDPRILKRYVNFMSNPDERTAIDQFGRDDKYFGVATMMATLPGLPMFGHGQVEGLAEKYGMEFRRARWTEESDTGLIHRHERQVFPLLRRRWAFAEVDHFRFYDLVQSDGAVDENVFAYSNGSGDGRSLVLFHNVFAETAGWLKTSVPVQTSPGGDDSTLRRTDLAHALELPDKKDAYAVLRDAATGLEFLRSCSELHEHGLYVELKAYSLHVFVTPRIVWDEDGRYSQLADGLRGRGVPSVDQALVELELADVLEPFGRLVAADVLTPLVEVQPDPDGARAAPAELESLTDTVGELLAAINLRTGGRSDPRTAASIVGDLQSWFVADNRDDATDRAAAAAFVVLRRLDDGAPEDSEDGLIREWLDGWSLLDVLSRSLDEMGFADSSVADVTGGIRAMFGCEELLDERPDWTGDLGEFVKGLAADPEVAAFLGINRYEGVDWFVSESWDDLLSHFSTVLSVRSDWADPPADVIAALTRLSEAKEASGYQVKQLLNVLGPEQVGRKK
jgi:hypothetical protein